MERSRSSRDNILTIILVLVLAGIGYVWYSYLESRPSGLVRSSTEGRSRESAGFIALLNILEKTNIDTTFFADPLFRGLGEKVELPPAPLLVGRPNPFEPLR